MAKLPRKQRENAIAVSHKELGKKRLENIVTEIQINPGPTPRVECIHFNRFELSEPFWESSSGAQVVTVGHPTEAMKLAYDNLNIIFRNIGKRWAITSIEMAKLGGSEIDSDWVCKAFAKTKEPIK